MAGIWFALDLKVLVLEATGYLSSMSIDQPGRGTAFVERSDSALRIVVPVKRHVFVIPFLMAWLVGWAVGEYFAVNQLLSGSQSMPTGGNIFMIAWLFAWTMAGPCVLWQVLWMAFGSEGITVTLSHLEHQKRVFGRAIRTRIYSIKDIANLRTAPAVSNRLHGEDQQALPDASSVAFDYGRSTIVVTPAIDEAEASFLCSEIGKYNLDIGRTMAG
jgi:hypothetical protein